MERVWATPWDQRDRDQDRSGCLMLPSRAAAVEALSPALRSQAGPVLITGDAGVGKTWLLERLEAESPADWRWLRIDLSPAIAVSDLYRLIAHGLGLSAQAGAASGRVEIADWLRERAADGESWVLAVDEAHGATNDVLEELRVLSNQARRPGGFAAIVLSGQTPLARRLTARALSAVSARIVARVHLRPVDIDEARSLVESQAPGAARDRERFEVDHRDSGGNPRRLVQLARLRAVAAPPRAAVEPRVTPPPARMPIAPPPDATPARRWEAPVLGELKPPILEEEGLIEVGWAPEAAPMAAEASSLTPRPASQGYALESEETITDHYAALQAWNEWAGNQGRTPSAISSESPAEGPATPTTAGLEPDDAAPPASSTPDVWAEGQQEFAPYSQLFSRTRQRRDNN